MGAAQLPWLCRKTTLTIRALLGRKAPVPLFKFMAKILNTDDLLEIVSYTKGFPNPRRQTPIQEFTYA